MNKRTQQPVLVLAVGTAKGGPVRTQGQGLMTDERGQPVESRLDRKGLEALEAKAGVYVLGVTPDRSDVEKIAGRVNARFESIEGPDERVPWEDFGYYLLFPVLPASLFWFRKGWTIRWQ